MNNGTLVVDSASCNIAAWPASRIAFVPYSTGVLLVESILDPTNVWLTRNVVEPAAWSFLDAKYQRWNDTCAINYASDESFPLGDHSELDDLWAEFSGTR
jgi:hypothetical protein